MSTGKMSEVKGGVSLDELQGETEKLLALLKDRQQGLMSWHELMRRQLLKMSALTSGVVQVVPRSIRDAGAYREKPCTEYDASAE